jgi:hypothetical protein
VFPAEFFEGFDELDEGADLERAVHLGELGEQPGEKGAGEEGSVTCVGGVIGTEGGEYGVRGGAKVEGVEGVFEEVVEGLDRGG